MSKPRNKNVSKCNCNISKLDFITSWTQS